LSIIAGNLSGAAAGFNRFGGVCALLYALTQDLDFQPASGGGFTKVYRIEHFFIVLLLRNLLIIAPVSVPF